LYSPALHDALPIWSDELHSILDGFGARFLLTLVRIVAHLADALLPGVENDLLQLVIQLVPKAATHHRHVLEEDLLVLEAVFEARLPELRAANALVRGLDAVDRALDQSERHVRPRDENRIGAEMLIALAVDGAAGEADLQPLHVLEGLDFLPGRIGVDIAEVQPTAEDLDLQLLLDPLVQLLTDRAIDDLVDPLAIKAVERRQRREVGIGDERAELPRAGRRHVDRALRESLGNVAAFEERAAMVDLGLEPAARLFVQGLNELLYRFVST